MGLCYVVKWTLSLPRSSPIRLCFLFTGDKGDESKAMVSGKGKKKKGEEGVLRNVYKSEAVHSSGPACVGAK